MSSSFKVSPPSLDSQGHPSDLVEHQVSRSSATKGCFPVATARPSTSATPKRQWLPRSSRTSSCLSSCSLVCSALNPIGKVQWLRDVSCGTRWYRIDPRWLWSSQSTSVLLFFKGVIWLFLATFAGIVPTVSLASFWCIPFH